MKFSNYLFLAALTLSLFFAGCAGSPERIDGSPFDQARYDNDEASCRSQVRNKYPNLARQGQMGGTSRTPARIPSTDNVQFAAMEFNSCMNGKGWK
jgi:hypothetical protein